MMTSAPRASAPTAPLYCNAREAGNEKREKKIQAAMSDELSGCEMNHLMGTEIIIIFFELYY